MIFFRFVDAILVYLGLFSSSAELDFCECCEREGEGFKCLEKLIFERGILNLCSFKI